MVTGLVLCSKKAIAPNSYLRSVKNREELLLQINQFYSLKLDRLSREQRKREPITGLAHTVIKSRHRIKGIHIGLRSANYFSN